MFDEKRKKKSDIIMIILGFIIFCIILFHFLNKKKYLLGHDKNQTQTLFLSIFYGYEWRLEINNFRICVRIILYILYGK